MQTWYVLEDDSVASPADVVRDKSGVLRHKDGRAVAMRPDGETPRSRGVDAEAEAAKVKPKTKQAPASRDRQVKAEDGGKATYKTR